ncbi:hypothetical protein FRC05_007188 [Tulasnella sp. 425]|nr:hypothetical protein FRC05_007188 [Tulasnella sp. 425]
MEMIPVEILVEILAYSLPPLTHAQARPRTTLALVCRHWNAVVEGTPILWSKIMWWDSLSQVERSLTKSDTHPIDIDGYWAFQYLRHPESDKFRRFLELVNCHMARWRHVNLMLVRDVSLGHTGSPAPLLESLQVHNGEYFWGVNRQVTKLHIAWMPRLREVQIHGLELVQLDIPFPPTLSKLIITGVMFSTPSFLKLHTILISCPGLTVLKLSARHDDWNEDDDWTTFPVVELPILRELTLLRPEKQVIQTILQRLQFPRECVVQLNSWFSDPDPSATLTSSLAHHRDYLHNGGINQITVTVRRHDFAVSARGARWNMESAFGSMDGARDIALWFNGESATPAEGLPHNRIPVTLDFGQDIPADTAFGYLSPISDLGCITSLKVDASQGAHVAILSHLARPATKEVAIPTWPLPGLRELHIEGPIAEIDPVIKFVEQRRGKGDRVGVPAPLQRIEFEGNQVEGGNPELTRQARPDSLLDLLNLLDWGAQVIWNGERVRRK